jgi:ribonuclease HI
LGGCLKYHLWFDGASRGNGVSAGAGCLIEGGSQPVELYQGLGKQTNNFAEYSGVLLGLNHIVSNFADFEDMTALEIKGDSKLVIHQLQGAWKVKSDNIRGLHRACSHQLTLLRNKGINIDLIYIPRAENSKADALANRGADLN